MKRTNGLEYVEVSSLYIRWWAIETIIDITLKKAVCFLIGHKTCSGWCLRCLGKIEEKNAEHKVN